MFSKTVGNRMGPVSGITPVSLLYKAEQKITTLPSSLKRVTRLLATVNGDRSKLQILLPNTQQPRGLGSWTVAELITIGWSSSK